MTVKLEAGKNIHSFYVLLKRYTHLFILCLIEYLRKLKDKKDVTSIVMYSVVPILSICIFVVPIPFVATGFDSTQCIAENILGDPKHRSNLTIFGTSAAERLVESIPLFDLTTFLNLRVR